MKKLALFVSLIALCFSFAFAGCSSRRVHIDGVTVTSSKPSFETGNMFEAEDIKEYYSTNNAMYVLLDSPFVGKNSVFIKKMGKDIVITSAGTYILKGTLNGRVVVDAGVEDKIKLVFDGVVINSSNGVALNIISAKKVILTLATETVNELSAIKYENITDFGSVLRSTCDLTINGEGSLNIIAPNGDGIECDKTLKLVNGKISIKAEADGIEVKESVRLKNSALTIEAEKDGVNVKNKEDNKLGFVYVENGTFDIKSGDDCISASSNLRIDNGIFNLFAGKESTKNNTSQKALKADTGIIINNGNFVINSVGDGIHSDDSISIFNGKFVIETSDDAVHSDAKLLVAGGEFNILNCYEGLEGLTLEILDGDIDIYSLDDAINTKEPPNGVADGTNRDIIISGGSITIRSDVDGIDSGYLCLLPKFDAYSNCGLCGRMCGFGRNVFCNRRVFGWWCVPKFRTGVFVCIPNATKRWRNSKNFYPKWRSLKRSCCRWGGKTSCV